MKNEEKNLTESLEKYLIAIYEISQKTKDIIVKDVAGYLGIGGASTAVAIKTLACRGFVNYVPYGTISLTAAGVNAVQLKIYRHKTISNFLNKVLEFDEDTSEKNASLIEYSMTDDVLEKFVHFLDFMNQCSCKEPRWLNSCKYSLRSGKVSDKCNECSIGCKGGCCSSK